MTDTQPSPPTLVPEVCVVVHPVDPVVHPTYSGHRWAVMVGGRPPADLDYCVGAGRADTESEAAVIGESHGAAAAQALRLMGCPIRYALLRLDHDPLPAEADHRPLARFDAPKG